jgi:hypothetical protein
MNTVYIETTIPSYIAANDSNHPEILSNQKSTRSWWLNYRKEYDLFSSQIVIDEISRGDEVASRKRLKLMQGIPRLHETATTVALAKTYVRLLQLPRKAALDAFHLAFAVEYEMDFLLTWNCRHILNGQTLLKLKDYNFRHGLSLPIVLSTQELIPGNS